MSGDFEPWNNSPSQSEAPKPEKDLYADSSKMARHARIVVLVDIVAAVLVVGFVIWYIFYRNH